MQHIVVGAAHRVRHQAVAHVAAVDEQVLQVGARARRVGQADAAMQRQRPHFAGQHAAACRRKPSPSTSRSRCSGGAARHCCNRRPSCHSANSTSGRASAWRRNASVQCASSVASLFRNLRRAGVLKNSSLTSTVVPRARAARRQLARACMQRKGMVRAVGAAGQRQLRHRRDGRQRLAAKAHRRDLLEVVERGDLAGGMAPERQRQLVGGDAQAIVFDHDRAHAAAAQPHHDAASRGIERVVDQLAHHRRRPLDHLAGGDLADQLARQFADRPPCDAVQRGLHGRAIVEGHLRACLDNGRPWRS